MTTNKDTERQIRIAKWMGLQPYESGYGWCYNGPQGMMQLPQYLTDRNAQAACIARMRHDQRIEFCKHLFKLRFGFDLYRSEDIRMEWGIFADLFAATESQVAEAIDRMILEKGKE